jgi:peptidase E
MTKFVLHGGFNKEKGFIKGDFFREMLKGAPVNAKVLLVYFAEGDEMRPLRIEQGKNQFEKNKGLKDIEIKIALSDSFIEECKWADVIFFSGGQTMRLMEALKVYSGLTDVLKDKIIGGDSAGANALGELFFSKNAQEIGEGLKNQ